MCGGEGLDHRRQCCARGISNAVASASAAATAADVAAAADVATTTDVATTAEVATRHGGDPKILDSPHMNWLGYPLRVKSSVDSRPNGNLSF